MLIACRHTARYVTTIMRSDVAMCGKNHNSIPQTEASSLLSQALSSAAKVNVT